ncbi:MAG: hypothetical protein ABI382_13905 [Nakamurella sp.]
MTAQPNTHARSPILLWGGDDLGRGPVKLPVASANKGVSILVLMGSGFVAE